MPNERINYAPETCARCAGSGEDPNKGILDPCSACGGSGWAHTYR